MSDMRNRRAKLGAPEYALGKRSVIYKARYHFVPASTVPSKGKREGPLQFVHSHSHSQSSPQPIRSSFGFCHVPSLDNTCRCSNLNFEPPTSPTLRLLTSSPPSRFLDRPSALSESHHDARRLHRQSDIAPVSYAALLPPLEPVSHPPPPLGHGRDPRGSLARASWS
jgi:hypothetical protein